MLSPTEFFLHPVDLLKTKSFIIFLLYSFVYYYIVMSYEFFGLEQYFSVEI